MNKQKFVEFIRKPKALELGDLKELEEVISEYPYFQNARAMLAKGSKVNALPDTNAKVATAAVYASDRVFLKKYLTDDIIILRSIKVTESVGDHPGEVRKFIPKPEVQEVPKKVVLPEPVQETGPKPHAPQPFPAPELSSPKKRFEPIRTEEPVKAIEQPRPVAQSTPSQEVRKEVEKETNTIVSTSSTSLDDLIDELNHDIAELKKSKARFNEIEKRLEEEDAVTKALEKATASVSKRIESKADEETDQKKKAKKISPQEPEAEKPKVLDKSLQASLIENFLITNPSIPVNTAKKEPPKNVGDLAADSARFDPKEVASEYLAEIFIEQGLKAQAKEIYKTLSLKFPDKSTYFADLIKKLDS